MKHIIIRLYLYFLLVIFFLTGGLAIFIFAPLYKLAFAPRAKWRSINAPRVWVHVYKIAWRSLSSKGYRDLYPCKLGDPPVFSNDPAIMRIRENWQGAADNCDACGDSCCARLNCPLLDNNGRCLSYGSIYFGYYFCGRYPSNQGQVNLYNCPKWEVRPEE